MNTSEHFQRRWNNAEPTPVSKKGLAMSEAIRVLHQRIENQFWTALLPWMETNPAAHKLLNKLFIIRQSIPPWTFWVRSMLLISLGFCLGLGIGMLASVIF